LLFDVYSKFLNQCHYESLVVLLICELILQELFFIVNDEEVDEEAVKEGVSFSSGSGQSRVEHHQDFLKEPQCDSELFP
jgi:hypothetical protein